MMDKNYVYGLEQRNIALEARVKELEAEVARLHKYERLCDDIFGMEKMVLWESGKIEWDKDKFFREIKIISNERDSAIEKMEEVFDENVSLQVKIAELEERMSKCK